MQENEGIERWTFREGESWRDDDNGEWMKYDAHVSLMQLAAPTWESIATAPKKPRLLLNGHGYAEYILATDGVEVVRCRWWQCDNGANNFIRDGNNAFSPTHWMPLPPPPA